jgi:peptidoglycan/LPS O-acetylase OafA/YrhL
MHQGSVASQGHAIRLSSRIPALDGLRGLAAFIVVVFHFLCLLVPTAVTGMTPSSTITIAKTPIALLWDGRFAVSVFFVLSGFVMAAAAERRHEMLITNTVTRYVRLAVPAMASAVLAWMLLSIFPTATTDLKNSAEIPSWWLGGTYQQPIPPVGDAVYDGLIGNFLTGRSRFNNVLWTMRFELIGSVGLFLAYWLSSGRSRLILLCVAGLVILGSARIHPAYVAFVLGALMYEAYARQRIGDLGRSIPVVALVIGLLLGAAGPEAAVQWGAPDWVPWRFKGAIPVVGATMLIYAILVLTVVGKFLSARLFQWLGRVSFGLYLVHAPLLYTVVAFAHTHFGWNAAVLAPAYLGATLALAHLFTLCIDEPVLRQIRHLRVLATRYGRPLIAGRIGRIPGPERPPPSPSIRPTD